ncbi:MAG TPA: nucleoside-diphosphate sugar epimerase/dehydratase, partial [Stellaceae bacterium]|nr:nucleoside-diphosphate sugar epimerase/dehydratase [Stellaceae bacterium]
SAGLSIMLSKYLNVRRLLIIAHDLIATAAAVLASFYLRFEAAGLAEREHTLLTFLPAFVVYAGIVYFFFHLYESKWRFASLPDLMNIFRASTVLAVSLVAFDYVLVSPNVLGQFFFGKTTILLYWLLQMVFLGGSRIAYRYFRYTRARHHARSPESNPTLVLGRAADAEVLLRAIESGAVKKTWPVGILSPSPADRGQTIRGISVLGDFDALDLVVHQLAQRNTIVARVIFTPSAFEPDARPEATIMHARRLGLTVSRLPSLDDGGELPRLAPVNVEDLLLRPTVKIDYVRLETFLKGRSIVVTGGGGSIGAEICDRVVTFGAARLLIVENSEPALHAVLEALATKQSRPKIEGRIADVRDRARMFRLMSDFKPDIVFHAAALKHVPLLEQDWEEGIKTNVFGSVNVADAAAAAGASAMVMISTDKAIEPVSVLGATKRFAEMYCQALDADLARRAQAARPSMRLIAVRFGNVLASNGSVVPKFKAQIDAGGPVTVTHPDVVRYFMTIREACDLVMTAASHALGPDRSDVSVYVLNMGQPVKIIDLAEQMIRLAGLEPGRDIDIVFTGLRPGERMQELLFAAGEPTVEIGFVGVVAARPAQPSIDAMRGWLVMLDQGLAREERQAIYRVLRDAVPDFTGVAA